jgi:hypothetical protein
VRRDNILSGDDGPDIDAAPIIDGGDIDAMTDGGEPTATIAGTIAITDVHLTHPGAEAAPPTGAGGVNGGAISISFTDLTTAGGQPVFGTSPIGACLVTEFDATHPPNPQVDVGPITISGDGLLKTVGPCTFVAAANQYLCVSAAGTAQDVTALNLPSPAPAGAFNYTLTEQTLTGQNLIGSYLQVNGFATAQYNSGLSAFPIVGHTLGANVLTVVNAAGEAAALTTETTANGVITVLNGFAPIPSSGDGRADFLEDETGEITITKAQNASWPAIDFTTYTRGEGFDLDDASSIPHAFPFATPAALSFTCAGTGGSCGAEGTATLEATILSGRASKKSTANLFPFQMPTEIPGTDNWLEWQCAYLLSDSATMPLAAVQAIVDFEPTRVEMRVLRVAGTIVNDGGVNEARILVGHGLVGHTDPPPAP